MPRGPVYGKPHIAPRPRVTDPSRFAQALQDAHYTYRSLAEVLGCPRSTLYDVGQGRSPVSPAFARRVEEVLQVDPGFLFAPAASASPDTTSADTGEPRKPRTDKLRGTAEPPVSNQ
jgi:transcriptional regulator with XRE-family HTH domain